MTDIAHWIGEAAQTSGRTVSIVQNRLPADDDAINLVVAPHEFFTLCEETDSAIERAATFSVPVCTEQPGTPWFNLTAGIIRDCPLAIDINPHGVQGLRDRGLEAVHLQLGGVPSMAAPTVSRDLDVLFLGGSTPRRGAQLASLAPQLWDRPAELRLFQFTAPVDGTVPGVVFGQHKYSLLARSRILLNIHRDDSSDGYFEWARMVEAMANGCAVLTEPSSGCEPLVPGEHFVATDDLERGLAELLDDPSRCNRIGEAARNAVLHELPLASSLAPILDRLDGEGPAATARRRHRKPAARAHRPPLLSEFKPAQGLRRRVYLALMAEQRLLRGIEQARCAIDHGVDDATERHDTPTYEQAKPAVSVIVTLYNYEHVVDETLTSIVSSADVDYEVVIVDDHSRDAGRARVLAFMADHPDVPMRLLGREVNRGLASARNLAVAESRADRIMVMDADNLLYPNCLRILSGALDADPEAAFAYATLEAFGHQPGLRSELAWFPRWLCEKNYIDAQSMIRTSTFERFGGYREDDDFVFGWEDWELWLRLASLGQHGVHVPRMLGRYRTQESSMITITNLVADEMYRHVRDLHPGLPWPDA